MTKIFYFDVETTGIDPVKNAIIQLSALVDINGEIKDTLDLFIQPREGKIIEDEALAVSGITNDDLKNFDIPTDAYNKLITFMDKHISRYDKYDKFYPAGYNTYFDYAFLQQFFIDSGDKYFGSWFNHRLLDPLAILRIADMRGKIKLPNYKLETVCEHYNVAVKAHDAKSDILAARELLKIICKEFNL